MSAQDHMKPGENDASSARPHSARLIVSDISDPAMPRQLCRLLYLHATLAPVLDAVRAGNWPVRASQYHGLNPGTPLRVELHADTDDTVLAAFDTIALADDDLVPDEITVRELAEHVLRTRQIGRNHGLDHDSAHRAVVALAAAGLLAARPRHDVADELAAERAELLARRGLDDRRDEFRGALRERCRAVVEHHDQVIPAQWPPVWQMATAFVLRDHRHLTMLGCTTTDAAHAVTRELGVEFFDAVWELHRAALDIPAAWTSPGAPAAADPIRLYAQIEVDHARWLMTTGDDQDFPDQTLSDDMAGLVGVTLPTTTRMMLTWAQVAVYPAAPTRVAASPAHNVAAMLIEITVPAPLWSETGAAGADLTGDDLTGDVQATVAAELAAISQFAETDAVITVETVSGTETR